MMTVLSVLAWIAISGFTVLCTGFIGLIFLASPIIDPNRRLIHRVASLWGRFLVSMCPGCRVQLFGRENIPQGRPVIFLANHQSYVDVPVLYFLGRHFKWVADQDLFKIPFMGWSMRMAGYLPVDREDSRSSESTLKQAAQWLDRGVSIFLFPEGTRSHTGAFGRFQLGAFRLAALTKAPLVPTVVVGTRQLLPRGSWVFRWGINLEIHILPPVEPSSSGLKAIYQRAAQVRGEMRQLYSRRLREFRRPGRP